MKYAIIVTCSKGKDLRCKTEDMPLHEMYNSGFGKSKATIAKMLSMEEDRSYYYVSPSGPGIVPYNFMYGWYDAMTSNKKLADPDFIKFHRDRAYEISPAFKNYTHIYYLGSKHYFEFLKKVFPDKIVTGMFDKFYRLNELIKIFSRIKTMGYPEYQLLKKYDFGMPFYIIDVKNIETLGTLRCVVDKNYNYLDSNITGAVDKYLKTKGQPTLKESRGKSEKILKQLWKDSAIKLKKEEKIIITLNFDNEEVFSKLSEPLDDVLRLRIKKR